MHVDMRSRQRIRRTSMGERCILRGPVRQAVEFVKARCLSCNEFESSSVKSSHNISRLALINSPPPNASRCNPIVCSEANASPIAMPWGESGPFVRAYNNLPEHVKGVPTCNVLVFATWHILLTQTLTLK